MNRAIWVLALVACRTPASSFTPACPTVTCPDYPSYQPTTACPRLPCPVKVEPPVPVPVVHDWHCLDVVFDNEPRWGMCFTLSTVCEQTRKAVRQRRLGRTSACATQRTAYCFGNTRAWTMSRQLVCARTAANCEVRRQHILKDLPDINDATGCKAMQNTDTYETMPPIGTP